MKEKKRKRTEALRTFEKMSEIWKIGSSKLFNDNNNHSRKKLKQHKESILNLDDCINANYNFESLRSRLVSQSNLKKLTKIWNLLHRKI